MEYVLLLAVIWYILGLVGSSIGTDCLCVDMDARHYLLALLGPLNLIAVLLVFRKEL